MNGADFLRGVVAAFPYAIHTVLTDNGMAFADLPKNRGRYPEMTAIFGGHIFDRVCKEHGIEHKLTKPYHPWTNGQAERMNRTVKEATIKAFHYIDLESLKAHVLAFVSAYNFAKHLKALKWKTPYQAICQAGPTRQKSSKLIRVTSSRDHTPSQLGGSRLGTRAPDNWQFLLRNQYVQDDQNYPSRSLLVTKDDENLSWKRLLRNAAANSQSGTVLKRLWDRLGNPGEWDRELAAITENQADVDAWRLAILRLRTHKQDSRNG